MGFNTYPALAIRQPDLGRTLATVAALKTSGLRNRLLEGKINLQSELAGLRGKMFGGDPSGARVTNALAAGGGPTPQAAAILQRGDAGRSMPGISSPIMRRYMALDPQGGSQIIGAIAKMNDEQRAQMKQQNEWTARLLLSVEDPSVPPERRQEAYTLALEHAKKMGLNVASISPQYDQQAVQRQIMLAMGVNDILAERERQQPKLATGYRRTPIGAEFIPGGSADPKVVKALAKYKPGDKTALQRDVPFIAKVLGITDAAAMTIALESKSKGKNATRDSMYLSALRYHGDPRAAWEATQEGMSYLYPDKNALTKPKPEPEPEPGWFEKMAKRLLGEKPAAAAAATRGASKKAAPRLGPRANVDIPANLSSLPLTKTATAAPAPAASTPGGTTVPAAAITLLQANPDLWQDFDAKYGAGMAEQYLGR